MLPFHWHSSLMLQISSLSTCSIIIFLDKYFNYASIILPHKRKLILSRALMTFILPNPMMMLSSPTYCISQLLLVGFIILFPFWNCPSFPYSLTSFISFLILHIWQYTLWVLFLQLQWPLHSLSVSTAYSYLCMWLLAGPFSCYTLSVGCFILLPHISCTQCDPPHSYLMHQLVPWDPDLSVFLLDDQKEPHS